MFIKNFNYENRIYYVGNYCDFFFVKIFLFREKTNMGSEIDKYGIAKKNRKNKSFIREEWPVPDKGILIKIYFLF